MTSTLTALRAFARYVESQADRPGWRLKPRLSESEVGEVEAMLGISLPTEYREFLLHVGSGWERCHLLTPSQSILELGGAKPSERFPFNNEDARIAIQLDLTRRGGIPRPSLEAESPPDGALRLIDAECGATDYLVLNGEQRGMVWQEWDLGFTPHYSLRQGRPTQLTFLSWLAEHYIAAGSSSRIVQVAG